MQVKNISQLRQSLLSNYEKLEKGSLSTKQAKELSDMAGKVMNSCKLEMSYAKHHSKKRKITFLES